MDRRTWISSGMWKDDDFAELDNEQKLLYIYILSSPESNMIGFYKLPPQYVEMCCGKKVRDALNRPSKLYAYNPESKQVLIPNYLKYNTVRSVQQFKGVNSCLLNMEFSPMYADFAIALHKWSGDAPFQYFDISIQKYIKMLADKETDAVRKAILNNLFI